MGCQNRHHGLLGFTGLRVIPPSRLGEGPKAWVFKISRFMGYLRYGLKGRRLYKVRRTTVAGLGRLVDAKGRSHTHISLFAAQNCVRGAPGLRPFSVQVKCPPKVRRRDRAARSPKRPPTKAVGRKSSADLRVRLHARCTAGH